MAPGVSSLEQQVARKAASQFHRQSVVRRVPYILKGKQVRVEARIHGRKTAPRVNTSQSKWQRRQGGGTGCGQIRRQEDAWRDFGHSIQPLLHEQMNTP